MNETYDTLTLMEPNALWDMIQSHEGEQFFTAKGLPFVYAIRGGEMFVDRREKAKSITRSTVWRAYKKICGGKRAGQPITGPKKLNLFDAPYIWAILTTLFPEFKNTASD